MVYQNEAKKSQYIDEIVVSTEDDEIYNLCSQYLKMHFKRPIEHAQDDTPDYPVFKHAINFFKNKSIHFDIVINLRPTSPLRTVSTIDDAISKFFSHQNVTSLRSMSVVEKHPYWMYKENAEFATPFIKGKSVNEFPQRQLLPKLYYVDGLIDIILSNNIEKNTLYGDKMLIYNSPKNEVLDIDNLEDLNKFHNYLD